MTWKDIKTSKEFWINQLAFLHPGGIHRSRGQPASERRSDDSPRDAEGRERQPSTGHCVDREAQAYRATGAADRRVSLTCARTPCTIAGKVLSET